MIEVEQKLKLVKRLLQEKVNQLKEQVSLCPSHLPDIPGCVGVQAVYVGP